jgi:hypothetical protein
MRPRDADFLDAGGRATGLARGLVDADETSLGGIRLLQLVPARRRLTAASVGSPAVAEWIGRSFGDPAGYQDCVAWLKAPFPPPARPPKLGDSMARAIRDLAEGFPGQPVSHGLKPSRLTKLARLALSANDGYAKERVVGAARRAYRHGAPYHAHEAIACALLHPRVTRQEREELLRKLLKHRLEQGGRSREKLLRLVDWASNLGLVAGRAFLL